VVAVLIGGIEALALIADTLDLKGGFWDLIGAASNNFGLLGYAVIGLFVVSWLVSVLFYKLKRYDDMPVNLG
jgi:high-affinity nickel-transport protein